MSMGISILHKYNDKTMLANINGYTYILKEVTPFDVPIYNKLINVYSPNLARVFGYQNIDNKTYVMVEYVNGISLEDYINNGEPIDEEFVKRVALSLCSGLSALHKNGIVHRDISPKNIIIGNGVIKLIDFGISRFIKMNKPRDTQILGTQGYAAPEQFGFNQTSPRSDIYAVGVLMNYMLTKKYPNEMQATGRFAPIIKKCVQIDEYKRYETVDQLKAAINKKGVSYFLLTLPGVRSNKSSIRTFASIYYISLVLWCALMFLVAMPHFLPFICIDSFFIFTGFVPVLIVFNYQSWVERTFEGVNKIESWILRIILTLASFLLAILLIILSPTIN